jgi:cold shock CspA family protein
MGKSQETYNKKEKEKLRLKKRKDKADKMIERKANPTAGGLDNMIAYVDENGHISDTPPSIIKKKIDHTTIEISIPKRTEEELPAIRKGRIDFFNDAKGFGFIKEHETNEKYFVHINGLIDRIQEGDVVTFELERGMKGMNAVRVKKA